LLAPTLEAQMSIGASIFLIVVGAILKFAINVDVPYVSLDVIGYILMAAGVIGLILSFVFWGPRRRRSSTQRRTYNDGGEQVTEEERYDDRRPPPVA
jgi:hypothetical protein